MRKCYVCGRKVPAGRDRGTCSEACAEKQRARQSKPGYLAKRRVWEREAWVTKPHYRERHRNYMREYMRGRRAEARGE